MHETNKIAAEHHELAAQAHVAPRPNITRNLNTKGRSGIPSGRSNTQNGRINSQKKPMTNPGRS